MAPAPRSSSMVVGLVLAGTILVASGQTRAADLGRPPVSVPRLASAPVIDCQLEEVAWREAAPLGPFVETRPGDNAPASLATAVRVGYTSQALYVSIRAEDDPRRVRATLAKRDAIVDDDVVTLYLDTFRDRRRSYVLMLNPLGIQQDGIVIEGSEPDFSADVVFQSKGCLTGTGYSIEAEIPFESLRYQAGPGRAWGLHVLRQIKHRDEEQSWMPLRRDRIGVERTSTREVRANFLSQAGLITGLEGVHAPRLLELIPVASLAHSARRQRPSEPGGIPSFRSQPGEADLGLTAKAMLTPSVGVDLALNPDFAEVEADQPQITANQRFPLFFEEKRPFFLEGADLFRTPLRAFYSRAVVDPAGAVKATGTFGRTSATALMGADHAPGNFTREELEDPVQGDARRLYAGHGALVGALRVRRDIGMQSSLGVLATTHNFVDRHNHVAGLDARLSLGPRTTWTAQALGSVSRLPFFDPASGGSPLRNGQGVGYFTELAQTGPRLSLQVAGEGYSPDYRATLGYTQRSDTNRWSAFARYNAPPRSEGVLVSWSALNTGLVQFDWRGRMQYAYLYPRLALAFKRQTSVTLSAYQDYIRVFEEEFGPSRTPTRPGAFAGPSGERSTAYHGFTIQATTAPSQKLSVQATFDRSWNNLDFDLGAGPRFPRVSPGALQDPNAPLDPGPGGASYAAASVTFQPSDALRLAGSYERTGLTRNDTGRVAFDQHLASLRLQYAFTPFASLRGRADYDSIDGRLFQQWVLSWAPRPGTAVYLGYDESGTLDGYEPFRSSRQAGYWRRDRTVFIKLSWAYRLRLGTRTNVASAAVSRRVARHDAQLEPFGAAHDR